MHGTKKDFEKEGYDVPYNVILIYQPAREMLVLIAHAQKLHFIVHADVSSRARALILGVSLQLHPNFIYWSIESSCESACLLINDTTKFS